MKQLILAILTIMYLSGCSSGAAADINAISSDSSIIAKGAVIFNQSCGGCHNFKQDGIGPQLGGLTSQVSAKWIQQFIKDPQKIISSGDRRATTLYKKYKVVMPSFPGFTNDQYRAIVAFIHTQKTPVRKPVKGDELLNPIPETIKLSNVVAGLELVAQMPASADSNKPPLTRITKLDFHPNTGVSFVLDMRGTLYKLTGSTPLKYMDITKLKPAFIEHPGFGTGFGSFAFHPQFSTNGLLYTTHTENANASKADFNYADSIKVTLQWILTEWKTDNPAASTFSGTGRELLRINMVAPNNGVQEITFNPNAKNGDEDYGFLYIGVGDGGSVEHGYPFLVHSPEKIWGTILRIDPTGRNSANGRYGIPDKNPFAKNANTKMRGEIYAYGFRNPHRITWSKSNQMLVSNIGHGNVESIDLVVKGHDYGWPIREGNFLLNPYGEMNKVYALPADDSNSHVTYAVAEYDHDEGKAICGGYEYSGDAVPSLKGKFVFGDIPLGRLFYIDMAAIKLGRQAPIKEWKVSFNGSARTLAELCGDKRVDLHFGKDFHGELYILTKADGKVYKLVSAM